MKQIAIAVITVIFLMVGCSRELDYKEISKEVLKKELNNIEDKKIVYGITMASKKDIIFSH